MTLVVGHGHRRGPRVDVGGVLLFYVDEADPGAEAQAHEAVATNVIGVVTTVAGPDATPRAAVPLVALTQRVAPVS